MEIDLQQLMAQAQEASRQLQSRQAALGQQEVVGQSGAGLVAATMNGRGELLRLRIDPRAYPLAPADSTFLEDLIVAAVNGALAEVQNLQQRELQTLTSSLGGPVPIGFSSNLPDPAGVGGG